jgi:hypothetical protein
LRKEFTMKEFVDVRSALGIRVQRNRQQRTLTLDQESYALDTLQKLGMSECKPMPTPLVDREISKLHEPQSQEEREEMKTVPYRDGLGRLLWLAGQTRPDLAFPVGVLARFMANPGRVHWANLKRVLRYLRGTADSKLTFAAHVHPRTTDASETEVSLLEAYSDADWASDVDQRRSTTGYMVMVNGNLVAWSSKKQPTVALSTAEAEYMGMSAATEELLWTMQFLSELGIQAKKPMVLFTDNQAARAIGKNEVSSQRTKHIDIRHHFVREQVALQQLEIKWIPTTEQLADLLTKSLAKPIFRTLRQRVQSCRDDED